MFVVDVLTSFLLTPLEKAAALPSLELFYVLTTLHILKEICDMVYMSCLADHMLSKPITLISRHYFPVYN